MPVEHSELGGRQFGGERLVFIGPASIVKATVSLKAIEPFGMTY
jgi:hypothetical protein